MTAHAYPTDDEAFEKLEHVNDRRVVYRGMLFALSTIISTYQHNQSATISVGARCTRCGMIWVAEMDRELVADAYEGNSSRFPPRPSPSTILRYMPGTRQILVKAGRHICLPAGYAPLPVESLDRVEPSAPAHEQHEAIVTNIVAATLRNGRF